ncbi:hypothetical protein HYX19_04600, partial [Candidatus Woesearchaeota archaeon]|nr:hypothetical protein [Candidatus Woesearchaeota archaeon]
RINTSINNKLTVSVSAPSPGGGSGGGGGGGGMSRQCTKDSDCKASQYCFEYKCYDHECLSDADCNIAEGESCYNHRCVRLFDVKIIRADSPIEPEQFFDFTYLMKGMGGIKGDVIVKFWLEKDGKTATSGSDTVYLGSFEEKTETTNIFLPTNTQIGSYDFYVEVDFQGHKTKAHRVIQISYGAPLVFDIELEKLPQVTFQDEFEFSIILSFNKDAPTLLFLEEKIYKEDKVIWHKERDLEITRTKTITENVGRLEPGSYKIELTGYYENNKTSKLSHSFSVKAVAKDYKSYVVPTLIGFAIFIILFIFWLERKKIKAVIIKEELSWEEPEKKESSPYKEVEQEPKKIKTVGSVLLKNFILNRLSEGETRQSITNRLEKAGWKREKIDLAFSELAQEHLNL